MTVITDGNMNAVLKVEADQILFSFSFSAPEKRIFIFR